jgi:hypothetical protein
LSKITGVVVAVSGPSMRAAFLVYSLLAFAGVLLFASAYGRVPGSKPVTYLAWLVLWPSLFFWPSSVGKEAFLLFGLGLAVWGFAHFPRIAAWPALAFGLLAVGMVRPHVAGVAMLAMCAGALMAGGSRGLIGRWYFQSIFWIGALALTVYLSSSALGIETTEEAVDLVERQAGLSAVGGSATEAAGLSWMQIPQALANTLFRPYVWEASSALLAISAAEILVLIALVIWRRRALWASLRGWRTHRLIGFCIVFVILYGLMLGYSMSNVGIIARQRVLLLPMLLLLLQQRDSEPEGT